MADKKLNKKFMKAFESDKVSTRIGNIRRAILKNHDDETQVKERYYNLTQKIYELVATVSLLQ